jgi:phosphatidylinositol glycan class T
LLKVQTPSTLLSLPLPDFSMPYNVIILTSTTIALFFGSIVNALMRSWYCVDVAEEEGEKEGGDKDKKQ